MSLNVETQLSRSTNVDEPPGNQKVRGPKLSLRQMKQTEDRHIGRETKNGWRGKRAAQEAKTRSCRRGTTRPA